MGVQPFADGLGREADDAVGSTAPRRALSARKARATSPLLTARGASAHDVMRAGNWKTVRMVAHYSAGAWAERGDVARYL